MGALLNGNGEVIAHIRLPNLNKRRGPNAHAGLLQGRQAGTS